MPDQSGRHQSRTDEYQIEEHSKQLAQDGDHIRVALCAEAIYLNSTRTSLCGTPSLFSKQ